MKNDLFKVRYFLNYSIQTWTMCVHKEYYIIREETRNRRIHTQISYLSVQVTFPIILKFKSAQEHHILIHQHRCLYEKCYKENNNQATFVSA